MREEHRRERREEGRGPSPRPGGPEWGPQPGRGPGRHGGERGERGFDGGPGWGGPGGRGRRRGWGETQAVGLPPMPTMPPMPPSPDPDGPFPTEIGFLGFRGPGYGRRGMRVRKGDVRAAILDLLDEGGEWNGYQLIQEIAGRTNGVWRPSAGSVYPALQQLEDEGLIAPEGEGRRRMYSLTDAGRAYAQEHADELRSSWDAVAGMTDEAAIEFHDLIRQVMMAVTEVRRAGSADQLAQARTVLAQARRSLYLILADDNVNPTEDTSPQDTGPQDTGPQDTGPQDTGPQDTGPQDTGAPEAAAPEAEA
jgi:DNA-binding PadR family transcriptional regulator